MRDAATFLPSGAATRDRWVSFVLHGAAAVVLLVLGWILADLLRHGLGRLSWSFLVAAPSDSGRGGGIAPMIVSTLWILAICLAVSLPVGLGAALFLTEAASRSTARTVRRSLDALAAVPSIVFGLFGNALFCHALGLGYSILSGGLTLACMVLPLIVRTTEAGLAAVPTEVRQGAAALALSKVTTLRTLILPAAAPALLIGLVLGIGRALAETAALIFTSGYVDRFPSSAYDSGRSLSIHIYDLSMNVPGGNDTAYATALILVVILILTQRAATVLIERFLTTEPSP